MVRRFYCAAALALAAVLVLGTLPRAAFASNDVVRLTLQGKPLVATGELVNDTTFVPVKALGVELGFTVTAYDPGRVTVAGPKSRMVFSTGSGIAVVGGHETRCDLPFLENDQLMVPARFFLENMGFRVGWSSDPAYTVDLTPVELNDLVIGTVRERQETVTLIVDIQYPKLSGLDSAQVQDTMNAYFASRTGPSLAQAYQSEKDNIAGGFTQWPTDVALNYTVKCNEKGFLGILFEDYLYTGGAHGMTLRAGYLADVKTGKTYGSLKDLFKDGTDYIPLLSAEVKKQFDTIGLTLLQPFEEIRPDQGFYVKDGDLVIYTDLYEYTAYALGFPEFRIPLSTLSNVLVPELVVLAQ